MNNDLAFIETEALAEELKCRFDAIIICGFKNIDLNNEFINRWVKGHALCTIGLCEYMKKGVIDGYDEISRPASDDVREH